MVGARGGYQDAFGLTIDAGWNYTGDELEFLRAIDRLRGELHRIPTPLEGFRAARGLGWEKGPPGSAPSPVEVRREGRAARREVPADPAELRRLILEFLHPPGTTISGSDIIDKFRGGGRGRSAIYLRTKGLIAPVLLELESAGLIARVKFAQARRGARWKLAPPSPES